MRLQASGEHAEGEVDCGEEDSAAVPLAQPIAVGQQVVVADGFQVEMGEGSCNLGDSKERSAGWELKLRIKQTRS